MAHKQPKRAHSVHPTTTLVAPSSTTTTIQDLSSSSNLVQSNALLSTQQQHNTTAPSVPGLGPLSFPELTVQGVIAKMLRPNERKWKNNNDDEEQPCENVNPSPKPLFSMNYNHHLQEAVYKVIEKMWAEDTTLKDRRYLWARFVEFCRKRKVNMEVEMDAAIVAFCENCKKYNKQVMKSSRLQYSKSLAAIARRLNFNVPITRMYQSGLRATGALQPEKQAKAITFPHLNLLLQQALHHPKERIRAQLYTCLYLMWKTCSRFDEVHRLSSNQIQIKSNKELIIDWNSKTKSTRADPHRPDSVISLVEEDGIPQLVLNTLRDLHLHTMLFIHTTNWFDLWVKSLPTPLDQYSAHSIKAGAVTLLGHAATFNHIQSHTISLMAKHKVSHPDLLPATTLRYIRDNEVKARLNESAKATSLLPWDTENNLLRQIASGAITSPPYDSDLEDEDEDVQSPLDLDGEEIQMMM